MRLHSFLRTPSEHGHFRVTYVELLFDLVFVFAITQLSHLLIEQFSLAAAGQALLLLLAVWWVWIFTAWVTNWIDPERLPVRALLLILTIVGLVLSAAIPQAFQSRGLAFASAYVFMQVGRTAFVVWAVRHRSGERSQFPAHSGVVCVCWHDLDRWRCGRGKHSLVAVGGGSHARVHFAVGGLLGAETRPVRNERLERRGGHMAERCGLFVMIALGESVLVTGATFAGLEWTNAMIAAFLTSLVGSIAMWWLYFATTADAGSERVSHSRNPGQLARLA